MEIRSIRHMGLRRLVEDDDSRGIWPDLIVRIRSILAALNQRSRHGGRSRPAGLAHPSLVRRSSRDLDHQRLRQLADHL